jgi:hypothetical protein
MRLALLSLLSFVLGCGSSQPPQGQISVLAQSQISAGQVSRVAVNVTPAGVTFDLTVDPLDPTRFTGTVSVPVGTQTVTATAFAGSTPVGTGTALVTVTKGAHMQALITILDATGPLPGPDHSPVVTSLVTPASVQVGDQPTLTATALDPDGDAMTFSWSASPSGCGTFGAPSALSTSFTAKTIGPCTVSFTVTANAKSDSKNAQILIVLATGFIDVTVQFVPQPVISSIALFSGSTQVAIVNRTGGGDGTIRAPFHKGTPYTVVLSFDAWPTGTITLSDSCGGTITEPVFVPNATTASGTWTPTVDSGVCNLTATLTRGTLIDAFFIVVLPVP